MKPFTQHKGLVAPIDRANIDTDAIIPKQFLRKIERTGFGQHLFHELRYLDYEGTKENPEFILNKEPFRQATILLTRENFGCGSSREHAPWALADFGIRVIVAPSFAEIFSNNCSKNGILLIRFNDNVIDKLFQQTGQDTPVSFEADLEKQTLTDAQGQIYSFEINSFAKECLLKGLDHIAWTCQFDGQIKAFEDKIEQEKPWL